MLKKNGNWKMPARRSLGTGGDVGNSQQSRSGFSLIEMLVVIFIFSILGVVSTQILALSLRNSQKSESIGSVRANIEYAVSNMERLLRNATSIDSTCGAGGSNVLDYKDENGVSGKFECVSGSIASGSASIAITSESVEIDCTVNVFTCPTPAAGVPQMVIIELTGEDKELGTGVEGSSVTVKTQIQLRDYESY